MGGGRDRARSTTRLPAALREELGLGEEAERPRHAKKPRLFAVSARKAARKEQRRAKHASRAPSSAHASRKAPSAPKAPSPSMPAERVTPLTKPKRAPTEHSATKQVMDPISGAFKTVQAPKRREPTKLERMSGESAVTPRAGPSRAVSKVERDEDDEIAWLEYQLSRSKGKMREDDDVDGMFFMLTADLLDDLDRFYSNMPHAMEEGEDLDEDSNDLEGDLNEAFDELESPQEDMDEEESEEEEEAPEDLEAPEDPENLALPSHQDFSPATSGTSINASRYVPPALRNAGPSASVSQQKLQRHINGQLNRLGEGNVDSIVSELEALYRSYARGDVTATITRLVLETMSASTNLSETVIVLYATLLTALHRIIGPEFGAYVLQDVVTRFLDVYGAWIAEAATSASNEDAQSARSRMCVNLVTLLAHLFNLKMLSAGILLDWVRLWLGQGFLTLVPGVQHRKPITELDIELILRLVQSSGAQLRHTDAESLKAIVDVTKRSLEEAAGDAPVAHSSRARFMLEALVHLRQKGKQLTRDLSATSERVQKMSKYLSSMEKRHTLRTQSALQVGLHDLEAAGHRGRWWLVGAAWAGHETPAPRAEEAPAMPQEADPASDDDTVDLSQLARTQGMNTDARRMIFSALMASLDYEDAVRNIMQLKLSEVQRREVIRVLIHCLAQEPAFNPYYVLIGQQLAQAQPGMRVTLQYVLWDYFRELGEARVGGAHVVQDDEEGVVDESLLDDPARMRKLVHLARAYGYWVATDSLSLSVLKPVDFTTLHGPATVFLQHMLLQLLLVTQTQAPMLTPRLRTRLARAPAPRDRERLERVMVKGTVGYPGLAQGLLVFVRLHMTHAQLERLLGDEDTAVLTRLMWATRTATETLSVGATAAA